MNREIKFRAMSKENGEWEYFNFNNSSDMRLLSEKIEKGWLNGLSQFTGLKDKNGVDIYEGDIVKHRELDRPEDGVMYGLQEQLMNIPREVMFEVCGFTPLAGWIDEAMEDMQWEVIGNIYENPNLLNL